MHKAAFWVFQKFEGELQKAINLLVAPDKAIIARKCQMQEAYSRDNKTWAPIGTPH